MKTTLLTVLAALTCSLAVAGESTAPAKPPYKNDPAIISIIKAVKPGQIVKLPKFRMMPKKVTSNHLYQKGPHRRDFCNKMPYAPDRKTGMYCGANHNIPHRLNDVWEYHLGSNTWHLILPSGGDYTRYARLRQKAGKLKKLKGQGKLKNPETFEQQVAEAKKIDKAWWLKHVVMKDGYIQDKANGGPVEPWHTWDAVTYNEKKKELYWDVCDSQNYKNIDNRSNTHVHKVRKHAKMTGHTFEELHKRLKPASSMYIYSPLKQRWMRQQGKGPFPLMRASASTLHYIPDIDRTIYYCCHGGSTGGYTEGMWSYNANTNRWKLLIPGGKVMNMVHKQKIAPSDELQVAYSTKSKQLVAVRANGTFIYDIATNKWSRGKDNEGFAHDATSVFVYDSNADVFLLLGRKGRSRWAKKCLSIFAYTLSTNSWEKTELSLLDDDKGPKWRRYGHGYTGYYDPEHNAFFLYGTKGCFIYRHKEKVVKK
jgi:hypothetical protein